MELEDIGAGRSQRAVQSVEVGGRLLLALAGCTSSMSLKDLAARAELPPSRAHPYLVSYGKLGLVIQDPTTGRYALGPTALQLGLTALHQFDPLRAAEPVAQTLASETGQAVALAVWGNFGPTVIRLIDARHPLHVAMRPGTVMSLFSTATGRAFASVLPTERIAAALAAGALGDATPATRPAVAELERQLAPIRAEMAGHGCCRAVGRPIPGVNAFSAPVFSHDGDPVLVMTLLGHQDNVPSSWSSPMAVATKRAAAEASARLGYAPAAVMTQRG